MQTNGGSWYLMRIVPYRTTENVIDGVVITFSDITDFKRMGVSLAERAEYAEGIIRTVRESLLVLRQGTENCIRQSLLLPDVPCNARRDRRPNPL